MGRPPVHAKAPRKDPLPLRNRGIPSLEDAVYPKLLSLLKSQYTIPIRDRDHTDKKAYYYYYNYGKQLSVSAVEHPVIGHDAEERILYTSQGRERKETIVLKCSEKHKCIDFFYCRSKGDCARKLKKRLDEVFTGISENDIQQYINTSRLNQEVKASFDNKPPLKPVTASKVWERIQIDLMSMEDMPVTHDGKVYRWILSVIDVFSRYLVLRPLYSKDTSVLAAELLQIFSDFGAPSIIQSDRGSEFLGSVIIVAKQLNVKMIHSSVKHPQSQGKDERSHRTIKSKMRFDIVQNVHHSKDDYDWVLTLPLYQTIYNTGHHRALGTSPFKVFFGREANYNLYPDMVDKIKHYMHGLTQVHCQRGVVFMVKMAEDVLFNEAIVYLLQKKYSMEYNMAVNFHQTKSLNLSTITADRLASEDSANCSTHPKAVTPVIIPPLMQERGVNPVHRSGGESERREK